MNQNLSVCCPYCGKTVQTDLASQNWASRATEVLCVPVIERVGNLATTGWVSKKKDPRLWGMLSIWNNTVGLLRGYHLQVDVMKSELRCDSMECNSSFDCYINLDPDHSFIDFWPHLTGRVARTEPYTLSGAKAFSEKLIESGQQLGTTPETFLILLAFVLTFFTLLPYIPFVSQQDLIFDQSVLRLSAALLVSLMVWTIRRLAEHIRGSYEALKDLIVITNPNSLHFWHNFTLGRVTGVWIPREKGKKGSRKGKFSIWPKFGDISVSQAVAVGGLPSVLIGLGVWIFRYLPQLDTFNLVVFSELVFWLMIMYITGVAAWIGFNVGVFVINNIARCPMKLTPFNGFDNLAPVKRIAILSLQLVIPVVFLPLIFAIALLVLPNAQDLLQMWLLPWVRIFLGFGLILIGLGDSGVLILGVIYIGLFSLLPTVRPTVAAGGVLQFDLLLSLTFLGIFLSILLGYQLFRAFGPLVRIVKEKKNETVGRLNRILGSLSEDLKKLDENTLKQGRIDETQRETILHEIKSVIELRDKVKATQIDILDLRTGFGVLSPFISSVVFPLALDYLKSRWNISS